MPATKPRIFIDTSALKHAVDRRIVARRFRKRLQWGDTDTEVELTRWMEEYPNQALQHDFRARLGFLPLIAHLAIRQRLELLSHNEVMWELIGLRHIHDTRGRFYGAPITHVSGPIPYGRVMAGGPLKREQYRLSFFESIKVPRFLELQHATGAVNAGPKRRLNQLADAFFIWCAEIAGAEYFLTTDIKLVNGCQNQRKYRPKVEVVAPDDLVKRLTTGRVIRLRDVGTYCWWAFKTRGRGSPDHSLEALRQTSRALNRADGFE